MASWYLTSWVYPQRHNTPTMPKKLIRIRLSDWHSGILSKLHKIIVIIERHGGPHKITVRTAGIIPTHKLFDIPLVPCQNNHMDAQPYHIPTAPPLTKDAIQAWWTMDTSTHIALGYCPQHRRRVQPSPMDHEYGRQPSCRGCGTWLTTLELVPLT